MRHGGEFENAVTNIIADTQYKRPTRRKHRDKVGWGAMLSTWYGPGIIERGQIDEPLFHQVTLVPGEKVKGVLLSAPGMNAGFEKKQK